MMSVGEITRAALRESGRYDLAEKLQDNRCGHPMVGVAFRDSWPDDDKRILYRAATCGYIAVAFPVCPIDGHVSHRDGAWCWPGGVEQFLEGMQ